MNLKILGGPILAVSILSVLIWPASLEFLLQLVFSEEGSIYPFEEPLVLLAEHLGMVLASSLAACGAGLAAALLSHLSRSTSVQKLFSFSTSLMQTVPPVAVLALLIPVAGFGNGPVFLALLFFGVLPVFNGAYGALQTVPEGVRNAARGCGFTGLQILVGIELPLAAPGILAGIRTSLLINIGTATIGATMGAGGLGRPIIAGITQFRYAYVLQGALTAAALALVIDRLFAAMVQDTGKETQARQHGPTHQKNQGANTEVALGKVH